MFRWGPIGQFTAALRQRVEPRFDLTHPPLHRVLLLVSIHLTAVAIMLATEDEFLDRAIFVLVWVILNCFWLTLLRRYTISALLSLLLVVLLVTLSRLKHEIVFMTINFFDLLVIDSDSFAFLLGMFPHLGKTIAAGCLLAIPIVVWTWRHDPLRERRRHAALAGGACFGLMIWISALNPDESWHVFRASNYVSKFARSGVETVADLWSQGWFDAAVAASGNIPVAPEYSCHPGRRPPHIILVHDESSFDIRAIDGIKVPEGYGRHFRSFDGQERQFLVESNGGSSWFAEYNVLTGLSSRSFGRLAFFLTRLAAGHVKRGLPLALRQCDYSTFSLYPAHGAFMSARHFHKTTGIEYFFDAKDLGTDKSEPDSFYFDAAAKLIAEQSAASPMFIYVYLAANHYPWTDQFHAELTPGWIDPGNAPRIDEYLRRQAMSEHDYKVFLAQLAERFPRESFLVVRYGDHQPELTTEMIEPGIDTQTLAQRMETFDPRYFTTYYAIDTVNYTPPQNAILPQVLDAPYMPLLIQELAGLPLPPSFVEQKKIFERCEGLFYGCRNGAEARRFNRLLIDAGLISGL